MKNNSFLQSLFSSKIMILLCLLTIGSTALAQTGTPDGYVFFSGTEYLANSTDGTSTFNPSSCIWRGTSGGNFTNGTYNLRMNSDIISTSDTRNCTLGGTESGTTGMSIYGTIYGTAYYLQYNSGSWTRTNSSSSSGCTVVFAVTKYDYPLLSVAPTVNSGRTTFSLVGESDTYTYTDAQYRVAYLDYVFYNNTHHYCLTNASDATTSAPAAETFTYTWSWVSTPASGHVTLNSSTGEVTYDNYFDTDTQLQLKLTAQSANRSFTAYSQTLLFEDEPVDPASVSANDMTVYVGTTQTASVTLTPNPCYRNLEFISSNSSIAQVNNAGVVSGVAMGSTTVTVKAYLLNNSDFLTTTFNVTVKNKVATPVISIEPNTSDNCATATVTLSCPTDGATIHYTTDGTTPTTSSSTYSSSFSVNNGSMVKALAVKDATGWDNSDMAALAYARPVLPTPTIEMSNGSVTFTCTEPGVTFHYTTNGTTPTASSTSWTGPTAITGLTNECTIKVIATKSCWDNSTVVSRQYIMATGANGSVVTLNDYEDHNWTYYAGIPADVDGENYNTNYAGKLYSPNPRNVKITYKANGGAVSISEPETTFVYYKTLEEGSTSGEYPYQVISNPFSKRPSEGTGDSKVYKGFAGWEITAGADYIKEKSENAVLGLDEEIVFENLPYPSVNCTSAEIELTATWTNATVVRNTTTGLSNSGTYETNIIVLSQNYNNAISPSCPCTIMMVEPDGSEDYRNSYSFSRGVTPPAGGIVKLEFAKWSPNANITMGGRNLWIGRGVTCSGTTRSVTLAGNSVNTNGQIAKIESGKYTSLTHYSASVTTFSTVSPQQRLTLGNDYDRAKRDWETTTPTLEFTGSLIMANGYNYNGVAEGNNAANNCMSYVLGKSGKFMTGVTVSAGAYDKCYYMSIYSGNRTGKRYLEIEGGEWVNIAGGRDNNIDGLKNTKDYINFSFRMRDGHVKGSIYGGAERFSVQGSRQIVITGGEINGWVAGGANGTTQQDGATAGMSYVYVGGNARVDSHESTTSIGASLGGNVYGAGCGYNNSSTSGQMTLGTNLVIGDNAYIERGAYGGGAFGYVPSNQSSYVYITGKVHVEGKSGNYTDRDDNTTNGIIGGVFGGARQRDGGYAKLYMTGGLIESGVYGGSNNTGTLSNDVTIIVTGGQVGTSSQNANIHGGGYGQNTGISGNVDVTLGTRNNSTGTTAGTAVVYGDVYGGSALGTVNGTTAADTYHTNVTLNKGIIYGSLYGGGLGDASNQAHVYGPVTVTVNGGKICSTTQGGLGAVFGCNNTNGRPQRSVLVKVTGGEMEYVYGGGNAAGYKGDPIVTISGGTVYQHVFGGGLGADITGNTKVTVKGTAHIKKNVYGGGSEGNVSDNTEVIIGEVPVP